MARVNRELQSKAARRDMTVEVPLRFRSSCHRGHDEARSEDEYGASGPSGQAGSAQARRRVQDAWCKEVRWKDVRWKDFGRKDLGRKDARWKGARWKDVLQDATAEDASREGRAGQGARQRASA